MRQRVFTALWAIPLVLVCVLFYLPGLDVPLLVFLIGLIAILGSLEFYRLAAQAGGRPLILFGMACALSFVIAAHFDSLYVNSALLASSAILPLIWLAWFRRESPKGTGEEESARLPLVKQPGTHGELAKGTDTDEEKHVRLPPSRLSASRRDRLVVDWGWTMAGILYMGWLLGHYVTLRELDHGRELVLLVLFSTFACDTAAFLVGRPWGRHLMAPVISPKKTWEGAVGGFIAAIAAALALRSLLNLGDWELPLSYIQVIALGCLIGLFAQLGDLLESLIKRRAGAKDSGRLMPGHGGILDRVDSLVFTGAIVYYYLIWVVD
jgi:CDP-diglyceride synthetase